MAPAAEDRQHQPHTAAPRFREPVLEQRLQEPKACQAAAGLEDEEDDDDNDEDDDNSSVSAPPPP